MVLHAKHGILCWGRATIELLIIVNKLVGTWAQQNITWQKNGGQDKNKGQHYTWKKRGSCETLTFKFLWKPNPHSRSFFKIIIDNILNTLSYSNCKHPYLHVNTL